MLNSMEYDSPVGMLKLVSDGRALQGLWLRGQKYFAAGLREQPVDRQDPVLRQVTVWLDRYFAGEKPDPSELPLAPQGTPFRRAVWQQLLRVPYGQTMTYGQLAVLTARALGKEKTSARAVGGAVGHNPISIIIPCHRIIGADGRLTGYAGGVEVKAALLKLERENTILK